MVTNSLTCVDQADLILVLDNGEITEQGTFYSLMLQDGPSAALLREYLNKRLEKLDREGEEDEEEGEAIRSMCKSHAWRRLKKKYRVWTFC